MAGSVENSLGIINMEDIGSEKLRRPFSLEEAAPYDLGYTPTKSSSYHVTEPESEVDRDSSELKRFLPLQKHGLLHKSSINKGTVNQRHIHWLYPTLMTISLLAGLLLAIGHHLYYRWLNGQPVGSVSRQQWSLRSIPLISFVAPATLSVTRSLFSNSTDAEVFNIGISNLSLQPEFVYSPRVDIVPVGASSRLARIVGAVAMSGQRQNLQSPNSQANISYNLQAYVPLLRCSSANATVQAQLITMLMKSSGSGKPFGYSLTPEDFSNRTFHWSINMASGENQAHGDIGYFGAVPTSDPIAGVHNSTVVPWWMSSQTDGIELANLHGEIWIAISRATAGTGNETLMEFISCQLCNSSLTIKVIFTDHISNITIIENKWMNDLYATRDPENFDSYFAYFKEISTYLIGSVSWEIDTLGEAYFDRLAELLNTHLATSSQVYYMDQNIMEKANLTNQTYLPDQVRDISFAQDIEDFALNSSSSLLSDITLCNKVTANVTSTYMENIYLYEATNLIFVYSLVLAISAAAVLFGAFAFYSNGLVYDTNVSTFAITMQNPEVSEILRNHSTGIQPLDKELGRLKLRFAGLEGFVRG